MTGRCAGIALTAALVPLTCFPEDHAGPSQIVAPMIDHVARPCARPSTRTKICALVLDDQTIALARVLFRAEQTKHFYWTEMFFDGSRHCAWLPTPSAGTRGIDYYVEAVDNEYEITRTRTESLRIDAECGLEPDLAPDTPSRVGTTASGQTPLPPGFEPATVETVP
jgi:hypothetical protein